MAARNSVSPSRDVLQDVTNSIIAALEAGTRPWQRPWSSSSTHQGSSLPRNGTNGRPYSGINYIILTMLGLRFSSPFWVTFKGAQELGGSVRRGEKGTHVVFWKQLSKEKRKDDGTIGVEHFPMMRSYVVFNLEQTDGCTLPKKLRAQPVAPAKDPVVAPIEPVSVDPIGPVQVCLDSLVGCTLSHGGDQAYFMPSVDAIRMPKPEAFTTPDHYRATLAHECTHATGVKHRLGRDMTGRFGDASVNVARIFLKTVEVKFPSCECGDRPLFGSGGLLGASAAFDW